MYSLRRLLTALTVIIASSVILLNARPAQTQTIIMKDDSAFLQPGQTSYTKWRITQRVKPLQQGQLADPYHLPPEADPSSFIFERRIRQGQDGNPSMSSVKTVSDNGVLVSAATVESGSIKHYDRASNIFSSSPVSEQTQTGPIPPLGGRIIGSQNTEWGPAWILSTAPMPVAPNEGAGTPYFADLRATSFERHITFLKDTQRVVQQIMQVTTASNEIVPVMTLTLEQLEIKDSKEVPDQDFHFTPPADAEDQTLAPTSIIQASIMTDISLVDVQRAVPFQLYAPNEQQAQLTFQGAKFNPVPQQQAKKDTRLFDIQAAADDGDVVETHYLPSSNAASKCIETDDSCSLKTLVITQGSAKQLHDKMQRQRLLWDTSKPIVIDAPDGRISGYLATGGGLQDADQIGFLAEVNGTFMFIIGQHYAEQEFLATLATLQRTPIK
jgi:hypothetical protein